MEHSAEVFVGIDVSNLRNAIAVADGAVAGFSGEMACWVRTVDQAGIVMIYCIRQADSRA